MRRAFEEFRHDFLAGRRALSEHRFWAFVQGVAAGKESSQTANEISIELVRDQDDEWVFILENSGRSDTEREHLTSVGDAIRSAKRMEPHQLMAAVSKGCLIFRQIGNGKWRAAADLSECVGRVIVAMSGENASKVGTRFGALNTSGGWLLTDAPIAIGIVESVLARVLGKIDAPGRIVGVSVFDGVKSGPCWLGRSPFLPVVSADGYQIEIRPEEDSKGAVACVEDQNASGIHRLESQGNLDGRFLLSPSTVAGERRSWARRLSFVADAYVHETLERRRPGVPMVEWDGIQEIDSPPPAFTPCVYRELRPY